jgi:hypothetical protein
MDQIQDNKNKVKTMKKQSTKLEKNLKSQNDIINDINNKIDTINENLDNIIKEINDIKEDIKNNSKENKKDKITKKKKEEEKCKNIKEEIKEDDEIFSNKKNKIYSKEAFYKIVFMLNIFIVILIAYLFFKMRSLEQKEKIEKIKENKMRKKYSFVNILESLSEDDIKFIQHAFETGEIINDNDGNLEEENEDDNNNNDIKISNKDNKDENIYKDLKGIINKNKKLKKNVKKEGD